MLKVLLAVQARNQSTRLPDKINKPFGNSTVLQTIVDTCKKVNPLPKVMQCEVKVISSTEDPVKDSSTYECPSDDLVSRYTQASEGYDAVVRITGDCPLISVQVISDVVRGLTQFDYISNTKNRTYPDGQDCQGISTKAMQYIHEHQKENREHPFYDLDFDYHFAKSFVDAGFSMTNLVSHERIILNPYLPMNKFSIDTEEDYQRCLEAYQP